MKPTVGQRVMISNPHNSSLVPTPTFGHVTDLDAEFIHKGVLGAYIEIFNPVPGGFHRVFVAESDFDEALTAVD